MAVSRYFASFEPFHRMLEERDQQKDEKKGKSNFLDISLSEEV